MFCICPLKHINRNKRGSSVYTLDFNEPHKNKAHAARSVEEGGGAKGHPRSMNV